MIFCGRCELYLYMRGRLLLTVLLLLLCSTVARADWWDNERVAYGFIYIYGSLAMLVYSGLYLLFFTITYKYIYTVGMRIYNVLTTLLFLLYAGFTIFLLVNYPMEKWHPLFLVASLVILGAGIASMVCIGKYIRE